MWVVLKSNWFVGGRRIRRGTPPSKPVEIPDKLEGKLPSTAKKLSNEEVAELGLAPGRGNEAPEPVAKVEMPVPDADHPTTFTEMAKHEPIDPIQAARDAAVRAEAAAKNKRKSKAKR